MKILITGGLGFIGSHLSEEFQNDGHEVIILTKSLKKKSNLENLKNIIIEKIDVTNFSKLNNSIDRHMPDLIIHLAGQTSHSKSFERPVSDINSNLKSTLFILEKIRTMKKKCDFVLGSTFIVVGPPQKLPVIEDTPCNPTTLYGANRLASEFYCKIYHNVYGLNTKIFRITNSYGPREQVIPNKNAINFLIYQASKGNDITIFNQGNFFRDIIFISDVISGIKTIIKKGKPGELYWISSYKKMWFNKLGKQLENLSDSKIMYVKTPKYSKKVDVGNFIVNNNKLRKLGWSPKINLDTGIKKTLEYFAHRKI